MLSSDALVQQQLITAWVSAGAAVIQAIGAIAAIWVSVQLARSSAKRAAEAERAALEREAAAERRAEERAAAADAAADARIARALASEQDQLVDAIIALGTELFDEVDLALEKAKVRFEGKRVTVSGGHAPELVSKLDELFPEWKPDSFCVSFYGWANADIFIAAWRAAGFRPVGHLAFTKRYASSARYLRNQHEVAYLLAKGRPAAPSAPVPDTMAFTYTGNRLHPTQKPIEILTPLIDSLCPPRGIVLDPFCGSGSTLVAAENTGRGYLGIELDSGHFETARRRLGLSD